MKQAMRGDHMKLRKFRISFWVDGHHYETVIEAATRSDARNMIQSQYNNKASNIMIYDA